MFNEQELDWEVYLRETASLIVKEQSPRRLLEVRLAALFWS